MSIIAVSNKIIIERSEKQEDDDIIIPEGAGNRKQEKGTVLSVGPGRRLLDGSFATPLVVAGDNVYYNPFGCTALSDEGKDYLVLTEEDILAVIK